MEWLRANPERAKPFWPNYRRHGLLIMITTAARGCGLVGTASRGLLCMACNQAAGVETRHKCCADWRITSKRLCSDSEGNWAVSLDRVL